MGRGGDALGAAGNPISTLRRRPSLSDLKSDLAVLKSIWLNKAQGGDHQSRLEHFYRDQAEACECCGCTRSRQVAITASLEPAGGDIPLPDQRSLLLCAAITQMTSSARHSCGAGGRCWLHVQPDCKITAEWSGSTWAEAPRCVAAGRTLQPSTRWEGMLATARPQAGALQLGLWAPASPHLAL